MFRLVTESDPHVDYFDEVAQERRTCAASGDRGLAATKVDAAVRAASTRPEAQSAKTRAA